MDRRCLLLQLVLGLCLAALRTEAAPSYNTALATEAMWYSAAAYCSPDKLLLWNCSACDNVPGVPTVRPIFHASAKDFTYGYATYNVRTNLIVVAFRGTNGLPTSPSFNSFESVLNWATNLNYHQVNYPNNSCSSGQPCMVHRGFFESYDSVKTQARSTVGALASTYPNARILVTGHSLGGALATLCAVDLVAYGVVTDPSRVSLYTFGAPRVGNKEFAAWALTGLNLFDTWRVVHGDDLVPHVPPLVVPGGETFFHIATEVWYKRDSPTAYKVCAPIGEDPTCSDSLLSYSVTSHEVYLGQYISQFCSNCSSSGRCPDRKWGRCCVLDCPAHCDPYHTCDMTTGRCYQCEDVLPHYWSPDCSQACAPHCDVAHACNRDNGQCYQCQPRTDKEPGWWDPYCNSTCPDNCDVFHTCNRDNGQCYQCKERTDKQPGYWGPHCENACPDNCDVFHTCNRDNGQCYQCKPRTETEPGYWGPHCENTCPQNCDLYHTCNRENGICYQCKEGFWGERCESVCPCCERKICDRDTGKCIGPPCGGSPSVLFGEQP
ncbi:Phospholipase A(1) DAD1, chloroplastic [Balamuthia mandrillaris]